MISGSVVLSRISHILGLRDESEDGDGQRRI